MKIQVMLSTTLRDHVPGYNPLDGMLLERPGPLAAGELAAEIGLPIAEIKIVMVNGRRSAMTTPLADGDRVGFFPAVGGG